ncbi:MULTISPECIES: thioredoxin domain-containing protein [unclassified Micromonospora]|uniref:thioredoxin domain-containing protein n=1 Tax=unclassified Micromonospora TaxID=2617518 RepID=UPI0011275A77|nr:MULTISPECIES: thioredoxin domain-containing protein [unclassified Micromonospora]MCK1808318.1 thioredoxin domain-containing protein [Micromonospora sp. R42106]MCK1834371.1 thioredoxin domain-containing protein [Micromonospora sp. R42003]MCK1844223.1 thioredoxin domain-containing protein [Micromonospora sp. R42004]MCM1015673.1 thioredoxin domain-containing protein [Micromonospora sp. XM-20-01]
MNRLAKATSPYLLQHADNPVDWWPWCDEAFAEAKRRDVPVLISVGYAACHWCHVMAHESFENEAVARLMNDDFVCVKVDREERPDVDAVYMTATQAMTGQGGWPMTVFATPDGTPFFCGTYFPRANFIRLLGSVATAWRDQREAVLRQGAAVVEAIGGAQAVGGVTAPLTAGLLDAAASQLAREYDETNGGFGGAPKFPPHMNLLFLLRHHQRTGSARSLEIVRHTCEAMARGGLNDQLAGGFARYSVDGHWTVPHFEKMLYDNALLLRVYTQLWRLTGDGLARRVARDTARFLADELHRAGEGFASALDADTDGVEGLTYVWTPDQLVEVLGADDGRFAADLFEVTAEGTFEHGSSVLRLARDVDDADPAVRARWQDVVGRLLAARDTRPQPARDDKVVAAWNGLAITAIAEFQQVAALLVSPDDEDANLMDGVLIVSDGAMRDAAEHLATVHVVDRRLRRVSRDKVVGEPAGVLEDYGCVAEAFCAMHQLTGEGRWLTLAGELLDVALARFAGPDGAFYDTADDAERLVTRPADPTDNATPSGRSAIVAALVAYAALTGETRYREAAEQTLSTVAPIVDRHARFTGYAATVGEALLSGPYEIAVATGDPEGDPLVAAARRHAPPGAVVVAGAPDQPGVPLLAGRPFVDGRPAAYVCRGFVCQRPVTGVEELVAQLG